MGGRKPGDRSRHRHRQVAVGRQSRHDLSIGPEIHSRGRPGRRGFAKVDDRGRSRQSVSVQQEAASAEIARLRVDDGEGEGDGDRGIHGVAAALEDLETGPGGDRVG